MISTRVRKIPTRKDRINDEPGECHVFSATPLDFTFAESNCAGVNDDPHHVVTCAVHAVFCQKR